MICQVLAVPPPAVRPSVKHDAQQRSEDDISHIIVNIIKANKTLQDNIKVITGRGSDIQRNLRVVDNMAHSINEGYPLVFHDGQGTGRVDADRKRDLQRGLQQEISFP